ncbi:GDSL-like Lipase/Acylhydrolase [Maioricimonas rarisocia]|uniref:GDSL-like Lipase/Acylhydrolase n=1 Tax=Maioricimonas rarisocia TaxID=2528026 RepID=A0A517Z1W6_9PLAN|nr:SGNH/GDSL hydrolase family protein [Maioricimonas rarisocia]QDU36468.1 GDSL-like Lipase/Acylhydrolase [Maioricimonas rarisocia]
MFRFLVTASCLVATVSLAGPLAAQQQARRRPPNPAFAKVEDKPGLPRVLLIGDSISIGYTVAVREKLEGEANVHRIPVNGGPTTRGVDQIDAWLGDSEWDVIHFNWGLHDLKYINDKGQLVDPDKGHQQVSLADYEKNLRELVKRLQQTGAQLIWCATTPVPPGAKGRVPGDEVKYNDVAAKVMQEMGVEINDLYAYAKPRLSEIQRPANVHFSPAGSAVLAEQVASSIREALKAQKQNES